MTRSIDHKPHCTPHTSHCPLQTTLHTPHTSDHTPHNTHYTAHHTPLTPHTTPHTLHTQHHTPKCRADLLSDHVEKLSPEEVSGYRAGVVRVIQGLHIGDWTDEQLFR